MLCLLFSPFYSMLAFPPSILARALFVQCSALDAVLLHSWFTNYALAHAFGKAMVVAGGTAAVL